MQDPPLQGSAPTNRLQRQAPSCLFLTCFLDCPVIELQHKNGKCPHTAYYIDKLERNGSSETCALAVLIGYL